MPRCVLVLELCTFTSHISFHSSLPASSELAIVQHCIQESKGEGVFVCAVGWRCTKERKNEGNGVGSGCEHCVVKAFGSGTLICHLPSRFYENERNKRLNLAAARQLNQNSVS